VPKNVTEKEPASAAVLGRQGAAAEADSVFRAMDGIAEAMP